MVGIRAAPERARPEQVWVARQVGELIATVSTGKIFALDKLSCSISLAMYERFQTRSQAARALGVTQPTVTLAVACETPVSLKFLISLCSLVGVSLVDLMQGNLDGAREAVDPVVFPRHSRNYKSSVSDTQLRLAAYDILQKVPEIGLKEVGDLIGVQRHLIYNRIPDVAEQLRIRRKQRELRDRWRANLRFGRKLCVAKRRLFSGGKEFTSTNVFDSVRLVARTEAQMRLFRFVRDKLHCL